MTIWNRIKENIIRLRDLTSVGLSNVVANAISGIFWIFIAGLVGVENYGEISYLIAIASVASVISFLGVGNALIVYIAKGVKIQPPLYFLATLSSVVTSLVLFSIFHNLAISLYVIGFVMCNLVLHESLGKRSYSSYSKYLLLQRILMVILAILLYFLFGTQGIILGFALSFFPYSVKLYKVFKESKIEMSLIRNRLRFIMDSYGLDISRMLTAQMDKLVIVPLFGFVILGHYQLGAQILAVMSILPGSVFSYLLPQESTGKSHTKLKKMTVLVSVIFAGIGIFLSPFVLPVLFPDFDQSVQVVQIMSLAIIPLTINLMYISKFLANEKSRIVIIGSIIYITIQIVGIIFLGKMLEMRGLAIATVLAATCESIYLIIVSRQISIKS